MIATKKQLSILERLLSLENVYKLDRMGHKAIFDFIGMVNKLETIKYHNYLMSLRSDVYITDLERQVIEDRVNSNRDKYTKVADEYCYHKESYELCGYPYVIHIMRQSWTKGFNDEGSWNQFSILDNGEKFPGIYNVLFDLGIYNIPKFEEYCNKKK